MPATDRIGRRYSVSVGRAMNTPTDETPVVILDIAYDPPRETAFDPIEAEVLGHELVRAGWRAREQRSGSQPG